MTNILGYGKKMISHINKTKNKFKPHTIHVHANNPPNINHPTYKPQWIQNLFAYFSIIFHPVCKLNSDSITPLAIHELSIFNSETITPIHVDSWCLYIEFRINRALTWRSMESVYWIQDQVRRTWCSEGSMYWIQNQGQPYMAIHRVYILNSDSIAPLHGDPWGLYAYLRINYTLTWCSMGSVYWILDQWRLYMAIHWGLCICGHR